MFLGGKRARKCDGIPSCFFLDEECIGCEGHPHYCKFRSPQGIFYCGSDGTTRVPGYEVCDGIPNCPDHEDELYCSHRFYCEANSSTHISWDKVCDLKKDCEDSSDELNCTYECEVGSINATAKCKQTHFYCEDGGEVKYIDYKKACDGNQNCKTGKDECQSWCIKSIFSNTKQLVKSKVLMPFIWIISLVAVFGNLFVMGFSAKGLVYPKRSCSNIEKSQLILVLNLSIADFLVGIYTLSMCILNITMSRGGYCLQDQNWRSGSTCSFLGILLLVGSEQSVFSLVIITTLRLKVVLKPFSRASIRLVWTLMGVAWLCSITLAIVPVLRASEDYFQTSIWYSQNPLVTKIEQHEVRDLTERLVMLQSKNPKLATGDGSPGSWSYLERLISNLNPTYEPARRFGFYSTHGVCLPNFFPDPEKDASWNFSLAIIMINFIAFFFILVGYLVIFRKATVIGISKTSSAERAASLQRKVTRIVVTDMICWIPICIMAFFQMSGKNLPEDVNVVAALILVPINSAANPFLYSGVPDWLGRKMTPIHTWLSTRVSSVRTQINQLSDQPEAYEMGQPRGSYSEAGRNRESSQEANSTDFQKYLLQTRTRGRAEPASGQLAFEESAESRDMI